MADYVDIIQKAANDVDKFVELCLTHAHEAANKKTSEKAIAYWRVDYRSRFFYAIVRKGKELNENAKEELLAKAIDLGKAALKRSNGGDINEEHAALASVDVNCPPQLRQDWCN